MQCRVQKRCVMYMASACMHACRHAEVRDQARALQQAGRAGVGATYWTSRSWPAKWCWSWR